MIRFVWSPRRPTPEEAATLAEEELGSVSSNDKITQQLRDRNVHFLAGPEPVAKDQPRGKAAALTADAPGRVSGSLLHGLLADMRDASTTLQTLQELGVPETDYAIELSVHPPVPTLPASAGSAGARSSATTVTGAGDLTPYQTYLDDPPDGLGVRQAWNVTDGRGDQVELADLELGFRRSHEDLPKIQVSSPIPNHYHGTMSLGVCCAKENASGITGISPNAHVRFESVNVNTVSTVQYPLASAAIRTCTGNLREGDVLLLELEGEYLLSADGSIQFSRILPIERSPDVAQEIAAATAKGIYVIEPSGNGGAEANLDGMPLRADAGAILVGAGYPRVRRWVTGTNYGSRVDVQGWGDGVVSTASEIGWATLYKPPGPPQPDGYYTRSFNGTSSAAAMVAGVVACLSGIAKAKRGNALKPKEMRDLLVKTGQAQTGAQHIGPLPNLVEAIKNL